MRWIESINWDGCNYQVIAVNAQGDKEDLPVSALHNFKFSRSSGARRIRVVTDFEAWKQVGPADYLAGMGFPEDMTSGQVVYQFEVSGKIFLVPAVVLMKGMFRPLRGMAHHLFRPQGLENAVIASLKGAEQSVGFFCAPRNDIGFNPERSESILEALSWMYCFASARRMWDSVFQWARVGTLGVDLPEAKARLVLRTSLYEGKWLVTDLTVVAVQTSESPFAFADKHPQFIEFHKAVNMEPHGRKKPPKQLLALPSRNGNWRLSNKEWAIVEGIVSSRKSFKYSLRKIVDCILYKFGQGVAWKNLAYGKLNKPVVAAAYQRMLKDGRWDALVGALQQLRMSNTGLSSTPSRTISSNSIPMPLQGRIP